MNTQNIISKIFFLFSVLFFLNGNAQNLTKVSNCNTSGDSFPSNLIEFNNKIYFIGKTAESGGYRRLFTSNGTLASTSQVAFFNTNPHNVANLIKTDNYMFFTYDDGIHGEEIWRTDGTEAGTVLVKDINLLNNGANGSFPNYLTLCNNKIFFIVTSPTKSIWVTDGTEAGTIPLNAHPYLKSLNNYYKLAVLNNEVYFNSGNESINQYGLYKTNGTVAGTVFLKDCMSATSQGQFATLNNVLYFSAYGKQSNGAWDTYGQEIWRTDGTSAGTYIVKDVNLTDSSNPNRFFTFNNKIFFTAVGSLSQGEELWATDGTTAGTYLVKDIAPGNTWSYIREFVNMGQLYFFVSNGSSSRQIWKTDGTEAGTQWVANGQHINAEDRSIIYNNKLYFFGNNLFNSNLYTFSPTTNELINPITKIMPTITSYDNSGESLNGNVDFLEFNNELYFRAYYDYVDLEVCKLNNALGIENIESTHVGIYPNPAKNSFTIQSPKAIKNITAHNVLGKQIEVNSLSNQQYFIEKPGVYFLTIELDNNQFITKKLIIQ
jgi:ELWxxDGT repeat protein